MKKRIKKLWVDALRSGEFKQGRGQMRRGRKNLAYCCLGVLEQIRCNETGAKFQDTGVLALDTMKWAGLDNDNPYLTYRQRRSGGFDAANLNDRGRSFDYIADRIEKYL